MIGPIQDRRYKFTFAFVNDDTMGVLPNASMTSTSIIGVINVRVNTSHSPIVR